MMQRISETAAGRIAAGLSERDWLVLRFVARHRFATTAHLQRMYFTGHATLSAATRASTRVLERLRRLRLLTRLERRIGGNQHGSGAYIWCLDVLGHRLTSPDGPRKRFYEASPTFLTHTLTVTETHVALQEAASAGTFELTKVEIETEAWRPYVTGAGTRSILKPDLMVTLSSRAYDDHWYIEIDLGTESLPVLLRKSRAYETYRRSGRAQAEHSVFPRVFWAMPTEERARRLHDALAADPGLTARLFTVATTNELLPTLRNPPP